MVCANRLRAAQGFVSRPLQSRLMLLRVSASWVKLCLSA